MSWNYAELSKLAKDAGGPEKLLETIELSSVSKGRKQMIPFIGLAAVGGSAIAFLISKIVNHHKESMQRDQVKIEQAKQEIITGIEEYDSIHDNVENSVVDKEEEANDDEREIS